MEILNIDEILSLLKQSQLYRTLTENGESSICVPKRYMIDSSSIDKNGRLIINSTKGFLELMEKLRYWMMDFLPYDQKKKHTQII